MYNKLFTKILDSSVWLEDKATRIVWFTFLAAMDEDGYAHFAAIGNLASRARVTDKEALDAVKLLEAPDENSSDPDNEGRRIERVPGGWIVLNAPKYRDLVTRIVIREQTRKRVEKHRLSKKTGVTLGNAHVTLSNESVTPSETEALSGSSVPAIALRGESTGAPINGEWKRLDWLQVGCLDQLKKLLGAREWRTRRKRWVKRAEEPERLSKVIAAVRAYAEENKIENMGSLAEQFWKTSV